VFSFEFTVNSKIENFLKQRGDFPGAYQRSLGGFPPSVIPGKKRYPLLFYKNNFIRTVRLELGKK